VTGGRPHVVDVAVVGGGPAGAAVAIHLARAGREVVVLERSPAWRWRAAGVFASPAAVAVLRRTGLDEATIRRVTRPIPAMRVATPSGTSFALTYGVETGGEPAVGFDRSALDPALLDLAAATGATVRPGVAVTAVRLAVERDRAAELDLAAADGPERLLARLVVGADGPRSVVARAVGVHRPVRLPARIGLSYHVADPRPDDLAIAARMEVIRDGYVGIAPVPGGRVNVGIVLGPSWAASLAADGAAAVSDAVLDALQPDADDALPWRGGPPCEAVAGASPLGVRTVRRAGPGWFLVGDAAGFLDPFTGEGLHRAFVSAELAAAAIIRGTPDHFERAMHRRFTAKDAVSWLVQTFLARPALFEYAARRLASRPSQRATMGLVMGDLVPASRALDPRELVALLRP
jgi:flavin-dependent dehydrogenase